MGAVCTTAEQDEVKAAQTDKIKTWFEDMRQESTTPFGLSMRYEKVSIPVIVTDSSNSNVFRTTGSRLEALRSVPVSQTGGIPAEEEDDDSSFSELNAVSIDRALASATSSEMNAGYIPKPSTRTLSEAKREAMSHPPNKPLPPRISITKDDDDVGPYGSRMPGTPPSKPLPARPTSDEFEPMVFEPLRLATSGSSGFEPMVVDIDTAQQSNNDAFMLPMVPTAVALVPGASTFPPSGPPTPPNNMMLCPGAPAVPNNIMLTPTIPKNIRLAPKPASDGYQKSNLQVPGGLTPPPVHQQFS